MGVSTTTNTRIYSGDGMTTAFSFPFYTFNLSDMNVYLYDTLAGGIVSQVSGVNYTISGTANNQGFYPNGVTVTFGTAPPATSYVVLTREPPEVQNYNLGNSNTLSSTALWQQLDYLTVLIQWLQDQVNRCIQLPAGFGPAFSPTLPSTAGLASAAGQYLLINQNANGMALSNTMPVFSSVVVPYTSLQTAGTSNAVTLFSLPAGAKLTNLIIKHSTAFAGTSITDVYAQLGISGSAGKFISDFDIYQNVADTAFQNVAPEYIASWANATNIQLNAVSTGANLANLSAGSVTVWYSYVMIA